MKARIVIDIELPVGLTPTEASSLARDERRLENLLRYLVGDAFAEYAKARGIGYVESRYGGQPKGWKDAKAINVAQSVSMAEALSRSARKGGVKVGEIGPFRVNKEGKLTTEEETT